MRSAVGTFHGLFAQFGVVGQFAIRSEEWRGEHVMSEPVTEPVVPLFAMRPVAQAGIQGHGGEEGQRDQHRAAIAVEEQREKKDERDRHQNQVGVNGQDRPGLWQKPARSSVEAPKDRHGRRVPK